MEDEELKKYCLPTNLCLLSSHDSYDPYEYSYGPFGTNLFDGKPVTIQIDNGDVLAQATSFIYHFSHKKFESVECFSFYVSNEIKILGVTDVFRV